MGRIGLVVIGRNEGERLRRCLESVRARGYTVVYVDSGSTDGSVAVAKTLDADVVELDTSIPFSAARARNEGFSRLAHLAPDLEYVHFIDGDCEMNANWIDRAARELDDRPDVAAVAGRLRERFPDATIYNRLCDMEWNGAIPGDVRAVGGIALYRTQMLRAVGGFDPTVIAGEEPELCFRLRQHGGKIVRLPDEMALHDAAMTRFGQWWRRNVRGGHAYAEGCHRYGRTPERFCVRECRSIWSYAAFWPILITGLTVFVSRYALILLALYPLLALRIAIFRHRARGDAWRHAWLYGAFVMLGKFPQLQGQLKYWSNKIRGKRNEIVEYKAPLVSAQRG